MSSLSSDPVGVLCEEYDKNDRLIEQLIDGKGNDSIIWDALLRMERDTALLLASYLENLLLLIKRDARK